MWAVSLEETVSSWMVSLYDFLLYLPVAKSNVINVIDPEVMLCVSSSLALTRRRLEDSGVFAYLSQVMALFISVLCYLRIKVYKFYLLCTISFSLKNPVYLQRFFFQTFRYF